MVTFPKRRRRAIHARQGHTEKHQGESEGGENVDQSLLKIYIYIFIYLAAPGLSCST